MRHVNVFARDKSRNYALLNGAKVAAFHRHQTDYVKGTFKTIGTILKAKEPTPPSRAPAPSAPRSQVRPSLHWQASTSEKNRSNGRFFLIVREFDNLKVCVYLSSFLWKSIFSYKTN